MNNMKSIKSIDWKPEGYEITGVNEGFKDAVWNGNELFVKVPKTWFSYVSSSVFSVSKVFNKATAAALDIFFFIKFMSPLREFNRDDMLRVLGISSAVFTEARKYLEESGLVVIDKTQYHSHKGGYQWLVKDININTGINWEDMMFNLKGTVFQDMINTYRDIDSVKDNEAVYRHNDTVVIDELPKWCFLSPYNELDYRFSDGDRKIGYMITEIDNFIKNVKNFGQSPKYVSGRIYHPFHNSKKIFRHNILYKGSPLTELFDLHCSFYTLSCALLKKRLPKNEFSRLFDMTFNGKLYDECAKLTYDTRDNAKEELQAWRNCTEAENHVRHKAVSMYMESNFPTYSKIIYEWDKYRNSDGNVVKKLQIDICEFETRVFADFSRFLADKYNVTPFLLHDAVYCSESDKNKLPENIKEIMNNWFIIKLNINNL